MKVEESYESDETGCIGSLLIEAAGVKGDVHNGPARVAQLAPSRCSFERGRDGSTHQTSHNFKI
jgi:hypothetical protein